MDWNYIEILNQIDLFGLSCALSNLREASPSFKETPRHISQRDRIYRMKLSFVVWMLIYVPIATSVEPISQSSGLACRISSFLSFIPFYPSSECCGSEWISFNKTCESYESLYTAFNTFYSLEVLS